LWIVLGLATGFFLGRHRVDLWPASLRVISFNDAQSGGTSTALVDTSHRLLRLVARLDTGARYPFAGGIVFLGNDSQSVDLSEGSLELELGPSSLSAFRLCLIEDLPGFTRDDQWQTARSECTDRELLPGTSTYSIPVGEFTTPAWWYVASGVRLSQIGPERRSRIVRLALQTTDGVPLRQEFELRIQSIRARSFHPLPFLLAVGTGLLASLLQIGLFWRKRAAPSSVTIAPGRAPTTENVSFQPIEAVSYADREREAIVELIAREYSDADLTLEKVAHAAGVPVDRVTNHIKIASGLMFKGFLNKVRGEAARKLLLETDLPIAEVAQRVGYGSIPHFNRVFKELFDTTPTSVREGSQIEG
jgi:AraC-like DNA-binding protein